MNLTSLYVLIFAIYVVLVILCNYLFHINRKVNLLMDWCKFLELMKFKDDKEFLRFLLDENEKEKCNEYK